MGKFNLKSGNAAPFKMMGSSPAKDMPHEANGIPPSKAAMMNKRHADEEHPHDLEPESPAKQTEVKETEVKEEEKKDFSDKSKYNIVREGRTSGIAQDIESGKYYSTSMGHEMVSDTTSNPFNPDLYEVEWSQKKDDE